MWVGEANSSAAISYQLTAFSNQDSRDKCQEHSKSQIAKSKQ
jgi:hypothetical protein